MNAELMILLVSLLIAAALVVGRRYFDDVETIDAHAERVLGANATQSRR